MSIKIGVLGKGMVGDTLSAGFKKHNFDVKQGSRGEFNSIAEWADIVVLAVKGSAAEAALDLIESKNIKNKTIIDVTNPIANSEPENGVLKFFTTLDNSLMETLQTKKPEANFVKAFSSVGNHLMVNPDFGGIKPSMFICGNNDQAKKQVGEILNLFGWEIEDMGSVTSARAIEPLCMLWCIPGFQHNQWTYAFKLLKK